MKPYDINKLKLSYSLLFAFIFLILIPAEVRGAGESPVFEGISAPTILDKKTIISGKITDSDVVAENEEQSLQNIILKANYKREDNSLLYISSVPVDKDGSWIFTRELPNGTHTLVFTAEDSIGNIVQSDPITVDAERHFISALYAKLIFVDTLNKTTFENDDYIDILRRDDTTRVSVSTNFEIKITDPKKSEKLQINESVAKPFIVYDSKNVEVTGRISEKTVSNPEPGTIILVFEPDRDLKYSTTYYLMFNPSMINKQLYGNSMAFYDQAGNSPIPLIKKITTVSETVRYASIDKKTANWEQNPHGYYTENVNTCANCHGTHASENPKLDQSDYDESNHSTLETNYCMACHDGTAAAPMPDSPESDIMSRHDISLISSHPSRAGSCSLCHNPHLTWSEENPNLLKDHYVYEHAEETVLPNDGEPVGKIDSRIQLCENCHDKATKSKIEEAEQSGDVYKVLNYRKGNNATGRIDVTEIITETGEKRLVDLEIDDYSLCFSCHNQEKKNEIITVRKDEVVTETTPFLDILSLYGDRESGHFINNYDNSSLNGPLPCAECHETHASKNIKLLKRKIGHENQGEDFVVVEADATTKSLSNAKEREFCLKCHNGSTAIYGITGSGLETHTPSVDEMNTGDNSCSSCHGYGENKSLSAAHAPKLSSKINSGLTGEKK